MAGKITSPIRLDFVQVGPRRAQDKQRQIYVKLGEIFYQLERTAVRPMNVIEQHDHTVIARKTLEGARHVSERTLANLARIPADAAHIHAVSKVESQQLTNERGLFVDLGSCQSCHAFHQFL